MEAKFSNRVKELIAMSRERALALKHDAIDVSHFVLAMLDLWREYPPNSRGSLKELLQSKKRLSELEKLLLDELSKHPWSRRKTEQKNVPLTRAAESVLKECYIIAESLSSNVITIAHLLISIVKTSREVGNVLGYFDITEESIRNGLDEEYIITYPVSEVSDAPLSLYFDLTQYSEQEILEIISILSDVYAAMSGDELEVKGILTFERAQELSTA